MASFRAVGVVLLSSLCWFGCPTPCTANAQCDDGLLCNGTETCVDKACAAGTPPACDDGVACTVDSCAERYRSCLHTVPDVDGDGYGAATCRDTVGVALGDDCNDSNPDIFPGNAERCTADDLDNDCDPATLGGLDADRDGYESNACHNALPDGGEHRGTDCDDAREEIHPGQAELCNSRDDNCNGQVDEGVSSIRYRDDDNDGWGTGPGAPGCVGPFTSHLGTDCDDTNPALHPGAVRCAGPQGNQYDLCTIDGGFVRGACPGQTCRPQPNGTGICL